MFFWFLSRIIFTFSQHRPVLLSSSLSPRCSIRRVANQKLRTLNPKTQYITQTFTLSAPNLSINGFDLDASTFPTVYLSDPSSSSSSASTTNKKKTRSSKKKQQEEEREIVQYEPFDARKRARVEELARQEEDLMREIAALKRKLAGAAAQDYAEGFWDGVQKDEVALAAARERALQQIGGGGSGVGHGDDGLENTAAPAAEAGDESKKDRKKTLLEGVDGPLDRQAEVQSTYAGVVDTLGRLKREMPATVAKMERARVAGEYVVTER